MASVNNRHSQNISSPSFFALCAAGDFTHRLERRFPLGSSRCIRLATLPGVRISLPLDDNGGGGSPLFFPVRLFLRPESAPAGPRGMGGPSPTSVPAKPPRRRPKQY